VSQIPEEIVDTTWREVAGLSAGDARTELERAAKQQPDLFGFVFGFTQECRREAHELAVYLYFVIHRIFQKAARAKIRPIKASKILRRLQRNEELLLSLEKAHPLFFEKAALTEASGQPFVVRYLVEAIMEAPQADDPVDLTEEETGTLFLALKTVIDVLDEARQQAEGV